MSVGANGGVLGSAAGAPLSQLRGDAERNAVDGAGRDRQTSETQRAEQISSVEEDQGASDRDADGRRQWQAPGGGEPNETTEAAPDITSTKQPAPAKDPTGESGGQLDLMG